MYTKNTIELEESGLSVYYFAGASIVAALCIMIVFKIHVDKLKHSPEQMGAILTKFFIGVAFCEVVPILLLVAGFATMQTGLEFNNLLLPLVCIFFSMIIAAVFIFLQTKVDVTQEMRGKVYTFAMIGLSLAISIPFFSLVGLLIQMQ
ncbi:hypothetical protein P4637_05875 [Halalkalibacterium halodurans]|uniref:hypothetical protein n=1 Tax=Halalkalibacterium halodurans TaxID=86665 RepID=UPI0002EA5AA1|nr:hypothetical protein [Halalkalibacterium halodurans]MDY7223748.1 hypothetical protein [Halalkalibacterium halodurans]MDY7242969.1 hypothetical protein [Halalkalibacterium halodurans]MED4084391.1 hypothetical protein [Halalkalibacterium halodurans]MED4103540.1 hypothetical protein [Halalkalibacterium halodurans]MED4150247.1 hypothetical protein [Halalkalibacterium halodurans]